MAQSSSRIAVLAALGANLAIALAKLVAFVFTGSAAMLAETLHSIADTGNEALLLFGQHQAKRQPTPLHPFGQGSERYFWSFVVAVLLFTVGAVLGIIEGVDKLLHPHEPKGLGWALAVLGISAVLEAFSLRTAARQARPYKGQSSYYRYIRRSKSAEIPVVLLEDTAALTGLAIAFAGVVLSHFTGIAQFDAVGSIAIGCLLGTVAFILAREMRSLIIGEAASIPVQQHVRDLLLQTQGVKSVVNLRTLQLSPEEIIVAATIDMTQPSVAILNDAEARVRDGVDQARFVYIKSDSTKSV